MAQIRKVTLIGAGGNIGPWILKALDDDPDFTVSVLARQSSKSTFPFHVTVHRVDDSYPDEEVLKAFQGQDAVVCSVNMGGVTKQIAFIDLAVKAGVKWFIPAEFGGNKAKAQFGVKTPLYDAKEAIHKHLIEMEKKGLSWTAITTGAFLDWGLSNGFIGFDIEDKRAKIYDSGDEQWTATTLPTIGLAVARAFKKPEEVKNRFIYIYSTRTSQNEILKVFEAVTEKKWDVEHIKFDDEIAAGQELLNQGNRLGIIPLILSHLIRENVGADFTKDVEADNDVLGLPTQNIEDIVKEVLAWPEERIEAARLV
ncbi:hypothetical protein PV08_08073 [Exophiala spinifera]|uniref:NmrA-like domain-containing protein n=1 Tax=Exophiala spinifera TaxID=91928 RepID=A0A0D1YD51_9EURO|nr:uncharacterized protein PV08_08073 [Exophiala spinifera]KIW12886.1 hypothetical protein PV08_08073 [Exophiala spinifera]